MNLKSIQPIFIYLIFSVLLFSCTNSVKSTSEKTISNGKPKIVNIINFIRLLEPRSEAITEEVLYETVVSQVSMMKEYNLGGTFLLQYDALMDSPYQQLLNNLPDSVFEIGAWWEIPQPLVENAGMVWRGRFPWDWHADVGFATGYTPKEREKLVDIYMNDFKEIFGYYPKSVGSWFIDAHTLYYMYEKYGIIASCNCKDQVGTDGYTLWGGYWNQAYYPSLKNAYMPAQNSENQIPVPIFRMLGSDPIRQYNNGIGTNIQGVISLEPVYEKAGGDPTWVNWYFNQFVEGAAMEFAYVQAGQENSFTWAEMEKGFQIQIPLIAKLRNENKIKVETLEQSGKWFKEKYKTTPATSVTVLEDLPRSDKKTVWFNSRFYRANLLWENGKLNFRDIHLFDENFASPYLTEKGTSNQCLYFTLPFVDGYIWSSKEKMAGLSFEASIDGNKIDLKGTKVDVDDSEKGILNITWTLESELGEFQFRLDENRIQVHLESAENLDWFLELNVDKNAKLPFKKIEAEKVSCTFDKMDYEVSVERGSFSVPGNENVFRLNPDEDSIILNLSGAN